MVVGITGGIGSGKSTIVKMFANIGDVAVYYADKEAKELMHTSIEIKQKLIKEFTEKAYVDGKLNRPFIAGIVFKDKAKLQILNNIVHPAVYKHLKTFITQNKHKDYILYENAILFENKSDAFCDKIITVIAPIEDRIKRVIKRDQITEKEVIARIDNQWNEVKKTLQSHYVIDNRTLSESKLQVFKIHNKLT